MMICRVIRAGWLGLSPDAVGILYVDLGIHAEHERSFKAPRLNQFIRLLVHPMPLLAGNIMNHLHLSWV